MANNPRKHRCAIYTRKSTEDGLEQDFNSLDAQREACGAYILSQASEGWEAVPEYYDDGGWSGGNMERPGIKQLLEDIKQGKVDIIVVYKVDRLTRSLADFAKIVEILDAHEASFVSITQSFNTTTSMGRLTLNVLLSFAQFEREVTGERIRDKVAASKKKGIWMGGPVPIGYDLGERRLIVNERDAKTVRTLFERYGALRSVPRLVDELAGKGYRTKLRTYKDGRQSGGKPFRTGPLTLMLQNPIYIGKVRHADMLYEGEHEAIIDQKLFDEVQAIFAANRYDKALGKSARNPSLLAGRMTDPQGRPMTPAHTSRGSKRFRYYVSRIAPGADRSDIWRLPSGDIERLVLEAVIKKLGTLTATYEQDAHTAANLVSRNAELAANLQTMSNAARRALILELDVKVQVNADTVTIDMAHHPDQPRHTFSLNARLTTRGNHLKLAIAPGHGSAHKDPDQTLLRLIAQAFAARDHIVFGQEQPSVAHFSKRYMGQLVRLSYLAPDIIAAIVHGIHPVDVTGRKIMRQNNIPLDWPSQRAMFGFTAKL